MDMDLRTYVKVYDDWLDPDICSKTIDALQQSKWEKNFFYSHARDNNYSPAGDKEHYICFDPISSDEYLKKRIWNALFKYTKDYNFPWFVDWTGFNKIKYNRYETGQVMALHCDHIKSMFDGTRKGNPTLTILGSLNDDYEGGDLVMWENTSYRLKAGSVMVFPSTFQYPHRVSEVTKGTRYTFVSWSW